MSLSRFYMTSRWWFYPMVAFAALCLAGLLLLGYAAVVAYPRLPSVGVLASYQPKIPLQIYSAEGDLLGEFGEERRAYVKIGDTPEKLKQAIIAAEDERFYEHGGVDYIGVLRAMRANFAAG